MNTQQTNLIIQRVLSGDTEAFRELVREYGLSLRSYLAGKMHHMDDIDDVAQEALLAAFYSLDRFDQELEFGAWLRGIARYKLLNHLRSSERRNSAMTRFRAEADAIIHEDLEREAAELKNINIEALLTCISRLPERARRVVRAGLDGVKGELLAAELSTTATAIYNLQWRTNQTLRKCVRKETQARG
ncbi:MAG: RNA polymerase sigma-70 factor (ECF subfamily) [Rhodothermales bacterium]|jgi:RNA polymerase sigma-70 factor (ECF subfamily)